VKDLGNPATPELLYSFTAHALNWLGPSWIELNKR